MSQSDTIVAQATPPGRGGVGILRVSGRQAKEVAMALLGKLPKPRYADYLPFKDTDGSVLDQGIALYFPGPNSFTGEDVLELQGHGGPVILDLLLKRILQMPEVRIARPGEFSERAKKHDVLVVPSDSFGCPGYVRISYCVAEKTILDSLPVFKAIMEELKAEN